MQLSIQLNEEEGDSLYSDFHSILIDVDMTDQDLMVQGWHNGPA